MAAGYALHESNFGTAIVLEAGANLVPHAHSESQLALWLGGSRARARVGQQTVDYSENLGLGVNAYEAHDMVLLENTGPALFLVFVISQDWLEHRSATEGKSFSFKSPQVFVDAKLRRSCWKVLNLMLSPAPARHEVDTLVLELLEDAVIGSEPVSKRPVPLPVTLDHRLRSAINYMRENVVEGGSMEEIAARVGLSRAHFFALFRDQLRTTPQVFWSGVKVEEAMKRVSEGAVLTDVALDLGFSAPGNFSRFFKEHTGVSPSIFKRATRSADSPVTVTGVPRMPAEKSVYGNGE
ncbi:helix-turn-helix domain-containing protein [Comamonas sp. J-3]|uniref:AraC family transcriptional regulator n=1 Tax=Comamonas trifloxystrobinivorans TaxID=3350256 RepID=UPI00372B761B